MSSRERIRRPKLERTEPIRSWSTLFATSAEGAGTNAGEGSAPQPRGGSLSDVVSRSVDLGYRVIDEYIRQGQKAARRFSDRSSGTGAMTNDLQEIATRMLQYSSDFAALWFEFVQMAAGSAARWPMPPVDGFGTSARPANRSQTSPPRTSASTKSDTADLTRVRVAVTSPQPTEVSVDLRLQTSGHGLVVQSLRAVDPSKPRLSDVAIVGARGDEPLTVRIRVPTDQPAGVYNGLIIEEETSRPVGTVSVRITAE